MLDGWPFYLAYVVSFLTIGAAWLAHTSITDRLVKADAVLLRLNLLVLLVVSFLPFPTRLVAEHLDEASGERVFVAMYGLTLLAIRLMLFALDEYARREHLTSVGEGQEEDVAHKHVLPIAIAYVVAILIGLASPEVAVGLYCLLAHLPGRPVQRAQASSVRPLVTDADDGTLLQAAAQPRSNATSADDRRTRGGAGCGAPSSSTRCRGS